MKRLMATALAATLMCGTAAFAQTDPQAGAQPAAPAAAQAGAQPAGVTDTQSGNTTVVSNLPGGQPPSEYPPCTHRGEDRCVARAGLSQGHHARAHHHKAKAKAAEPASGNTTGA